MGPRLGILEVGSRRAPRTATHKGKREEKEEKGREREGRWEDGQCNRLTIGPGQGSLDGRAAV